MKTTTPTAASGSGASRMTAVASTTRAAKTISARDGASPAIGLPSTPATSPPPGPEPTDDDRERADDQSRSNPEPAANQGGGRVHREDLESGDLNGAALWTRPRPNHETQHVQSRRQPIGDRNRDWRLLVIGRAHVDDRAPLGVLGNGVRLSPVYGQVDLPGVG